MKFIGGNLNSQTMNSIILEKIEVNGSSVSYKIKISESLKKYFSTDTLFIDYGEDITSIPKSILSIPFIGTLITFSWITDSVLWIKEIDETYYESTKKLKLAFQELYPGFKLSGRLVPAKIVPNVLNEHQPNKSILLFSGGIDAHTTYIRNKTKELTLCNIQGWYKSPEERNQVAEADFNDISAFATMHSCTTAFLKSNFAQLINNRFDKDFRSKTGDSYWHGFLHSTAFIALAIPIAYFHSIPQILIASSFTIGDERICASYPTTDSCHYFANTGYTTHDGFELSRQDKIALIVKHQKNSGQPYPIRVCSFNDHNCCTCEKCFRTILGIIAENGNLADFDFNIKQPLAKFYNDHMNNHLDQFGIRNEMISHWPHIIKRMKENYQSINEKEFVDWFLNYDFKKNRKKALLRYYRTNFFSILRRKMKH